MAHRRYLIVIGAVLAAGALTVAIAGLAAEGGLWGAGPEGVLILTMGAVLVLYLLARRGGRR